MRKEQKNISVKPGSDVGDGVIHEWLHKKERAPFLFQKQAWKAIVSSESGLINAPTGYGKTFSVFLEIGRAHV